MTLRSMSYILSGQRFFWTNELMNDGDIIETPIKYSTVKNGAFGITKQRFKSFPDEIKPEQRLKKKSRLRLIYEENNPYPLSIVHGDNVKLKSKDDIKKLSNIKSGELIGGIHDHEVKKVMEQRFVEQILTLHFTKKDMLIIALIIGVLAISAYSLYSMQQLTNNINGLTVQLKSLTDLFNTFIHGGIPTT